ncbi:MAG: hypothetical protein LQ338_006704 [Usnochroma carphineum]|nr:MAG: hypothetical protein LQ338_006704 [Usnochroma carphineum]
MPQWSSALMEKEALPASQSSGSTNMTTDIAPDTRSGISPASPSKSKRSKPKAQPTVTPRTFTRFFTPRSSLSRGCKISASRQALKDITSSGANRATNSRQRSPKKDRVVLHERGNRASTYARKKRKIEAPPSPTITADGSSPLQRVSAPADELLQSSDVDYNSALGDLDYDSEEDLAPAAARRLEPIVRSQRTPVTGLLSRELGLGVPKQHRLPICSGLDWQSETADFCSSPHESHVCDNPVDTSKNTLPFCSVACNTNSLVAIGDEDGAIRLLDTGEDGKSQFDQAYLTFRPHTNAIMDLAFSPDDLVLATAAGDQTAQIIDMPTQCITHVFADHLATVKQIKFQPGSSSVIATSSRDGSVMLWDLRCKGSNNHVRGLHTSLNGSADGQASGSPPKRITYSRCVDSIIDAHLYRGHPSLVAAYAALTDETYDMPSRNQTSAKHGYHSVTSLAFLPPGREHLLLTASEANTSVRLWDLRMAHSYRRSSEAVPLSSTRQPDSHAEHREFGITSLALSGDGGRFYALSRDNTIYAYSTSHLILGHAPELSSISENNNSLIRKSRFSRHTEKEGLGPIYGFRHPLFHATSFFVKIAVRAAKNDRSELLAAGSSDGCAVLWPTDERYLHRRNPRIRDIPLNSTIPGSKAPPGPYNTPPSSASHSPRPSLPRTTSRARLNDTVPIYTHGTPLIRGHDREVTGLSWAYGGDLVTVSDDCTTRCWREDQGRARDLRVGGEGEGRRWDCGWADVGEGWDEEE